VHGQRLRPRRNSDADRKETGFDDLERDDRFVDRSIGLTDNAENR
jgi:hypothetical protein